jgi:hypothetical protein
MRDEDKIMFILEDYWVKKKKNNGSNSQQK